MDSVKNKIRNVSPRENFRFAALVLLVIAAAALAGRQRSFLPLSGSPAAFGSVGLSPQPADPISRRRDVRGDCPATLLLMAPAARLPGLLSYIRDTGRSLRETGGPFVYCGVEQLVSSAGS